MTQALLLLVVAATSGAAVWLGRRRLGLDPARLPAALGRALEVVGLAVLCLAANAALAVAAVVALRALTPLPLSLYVVGPTLVGLSGLQALALSAWAEKSWSGPGPPWYDGPDKGAS